MINVQPKKQLSQNWLNDEDALAAMVEAGEVSAGDVVLEIGPGPGALTRHLLAAGGEVTAVEFDREWAKELSKKIVDNSFTLIQDNFLKFDLSVMPAGYKVVANIPYHITAKIIQKCLQADSKPSVMALLVQKEVAERVAAQPGDMSVLAVSVQMFADVAALEVVPAELFTPAPKVDSQILQIRMLECPRFNVDEKCFFRLVKAGFGERRKKLINALSGGLQLEKTTVEQLLEQAKIAKTARAQELSLDMWYTLYTKYESSNF